MATDINVLSLSGAVPIQRKPATESAGTPLPVSGQDTARATAKPGVQAADPAGPQDRQSITESVDDLNSLVQELQRELRFTVDDDSGETIVKVVDRTTDEVLRQIPSEELLHLRERLKAATGAIFSGEA